VGKSTLVKQFGAEFDYFISLNLEHRPHHAYFEELDGISEMVGTILLDHKVPLQGSSILLFIDEIQESPRAIQMLRYFYEDYPDLHVIAAGSLLEFALKEIESFPVGRVEQLVVHPFSFEEFLLATDNQLLLDELNKVPVRSHAHKSLLHAFHQYVMVGGMPEVLKQYVQDESPVNLPEIYEGLWQGYLDDVEKYGMNTSLRQVIRHVIATAPAEKDRVTFAGFGHSNYKSREVGEALRALDKARLIQLIYPVTNDQLPLQVDYKRKPRLQFIDTGLLNHTLGLQAKLIGVKDLNDFYRGKVIQHMVTQELQAQYDMPSYKPHFWVRENVNSNAEVDLIYTYDRHVIPIEIKSGKLGTMRSLHEFIDRSGYKVAVRMSANTYAVEQVSTPKGTTFTLINLPYYLTSRLKEYLDHSIGNNSN
jgi:predicted AAA+ superfamily ATPase